MRSTTGFGFGPLEDQCFWAILMVQANREVAMQFSVGDVVCLNSHPAHRMTVVDVDGFDITCRWFEGAAVKEGTFPAVSIKKVD
jgi:uncharacterized protein YodC (DUF2158 family)